jgi:O-antigen ligase
MVASEYKIIGGRSQQAALGGQTDSGSILELLVYALVGAFLLFQLTSPPRWTRWPTPLMAMWGFTLAMTLGATWSPFPLFALARAGQLIVVAWLATAVAQHATPTNLSRLCHSYVTVVAISVGLGVAGIRGHIPQQEGRFNWLYLHPNIAGAFLGIGVTVALALLLRRGEPGSLFAPWPLAAYIVLFLVNLGGLLATQSRGALTGAVLGIVLVLLFSGHRGRWVDRLLVCACVGTIGWALAESGIISYWQRGESQQQLSTLNSRTEVWGQAWQLFERRPFLGHGFTSARGVFLRTFDLGGAHNAYVEVLVNSGAFGIAWWGALLLIALAGANRLRRRGHPDGPLLLGVLGFLLVNALTAGGLGQAATVQNVWLFLIVGWLVAAPRLDWRRPVAPPPPPLRVTPLLADGSARPASGGNGAGGPVPAPLGHGPRREHA